jgi:hypothetical protein
LVLVKITKEREEWRDGWKTTERSVKKRQIIQKTTMTSEVIILA